MGVHNGASTLRETIRSILSQDGVSIEFVIVNDGSTDDTGEILAEYARKDPRIRVLIQENEGLTRALIAGCAAARGRYIARQDCGDISLPKRLARQVAVLDEHHECVFTSCWTVIRGPAGEYLSTSKGTGIATVPMRILNDDMEWGIVDGPTSHPSVMFRADAYRAVGGYRDAFYFGQDWDLWYRLAAHGDFCMISDNLCEARVYPGSISGSWKSVQEQYAAQSRRALRLRQQGLSDMEALEAARKIVRPKPNARATRRQQAEGSYFIARSLARLNDRRAQGYLFDALRLDPFHMRSWLALGELKFISRSSMKK
jgi:glycosyltransferase involved in cell wall biosynthesis